MVLGKCPPIGSASTVVALAAREKIRNDPSTHHERHRASDLDGEVHGDPRARLCGPLGPSVVGLNPVEAATSKTRSHSLPVKASARSRVE